MNSKVLYVSQLMVPISSSAVFFVQPLPNAGNNILCHLVYVQSQLMCILFSSLDIFKREASFDLQIVL